MKVSLDSLLSAGTPHLSQRAAAIVKHCLVCLHQSPLCVQDENMLRKKIHELAKLPLILPQLFFCLLEVLYIRAGSVPPDKFSTFVAERLDPNKKPPIDAIVATKTRLDLAWFSRDQ